MIKEQLENRLVNFGIVMCIVVLVYVLAYVLISSIQLVLHEADVPEQFGGRYVHGGERKFVVSGVVVRTSIACYFIWSKVEGPEEALRIAQEIPATLPYYPTHMHEPKHLDNCEVTGKWKENGWKPWVAYLRHPDDKYLPFIY